MKQTDAPGKKRAYHSPRRRAQAQETRRKIVAAARRLFAAHGYVATTLPAIASAAGVSAPTLTAVFGPKLAILDALIKADVRGDEAPAPLAARPWWEGMLRESDPPRQLARYAANVRRIHERTTDLFEIVRGAAAADPEIAAHHQEMSTARLEDNREVAESLAAKQGLGPGVTVGHAADLLWTLGSADVYRMLVAERGWSPDEYERWLASSLIHSLLGRPSDTS
jgi:AcrR family transcriptional regulator